MNKRQRRRCFSIAVSAALAMMTGCASMQQAEDAADTDPVYRIEQVRVSGRTMFVACANCPAPTQKIVDDGVDKPRNTSPNAEINPASAPEKIPGEPLENSMVYGELIKRFNSMAIPANDSAGAGVTQHNNAVQPAVTTSPSFGGTATQQNPPAEPATVATPTKSDENTTKSGGPSEPVTPAVTTAPSVEKLKPEGPAKPSAMPDHTNNVNHTTRVETHGIQPVPAAVVTVNFGFDSTNIDNEGVFDIHAAAADLARAKEIRITGYTCSAGTLVYNQYLALRRAMRVAKELDDAGVTAAVIKTQGKGNCCYIASNDTPEDRAKNRRVEIEIAYSTADVAGNIKQSKVNLNHGYSASAKLALAGLPNSQK